MFEKPYNLALYGVSLVLLVLGIFLETNLTAIIAVAAFVTWDIGYLLSRVSMRGRTIDLALQQTQNIREHTSYFLAFYGVFFAILFTQSSDKQSQFLKICAEAGIPLTVLVLPFLLVSIPILFFPIQLAKGDTDKPSSALKALVSISALFQKIAIFLFMHAILRIIKVLAESVS